MKTTDPRFIAILLCPSCKSPNLEHRQEQLVCEKCQSTYPIINSVPHLIHQELVEQYKKYNREVLSPVNKFKTFIKKFPWLFRLLTCAIGGISYFGWSPQKALKKIYQKDNLQDKIIINIGSGIKRIHSEVINLDIFPFKKVDFVTDATKLPIKDGSVDMVITESTLEHIPDAELAIQEICRVVKPGGFVYISVPFLMPFHASPNDYFRLTSAGIKHKFAIFEEQRVGMNGGPASALVALLMNLLALPFSLISTSLYNFAAYIIVVILSPLRILDLLFYLFPNSTDAAAMTYFVGKKRSK